ncbi:MAG: nitroreductase family protein [Acidobacteriota bacterium]|jgi:nitroreductase/NAD-dependent dihydropyrimidine dehydrogenase PreA subunit|nr:nitroreductase family protein [Acidobacteriota bacterium]
MGLLIIDEKKCRKDGICARECPAAVINLSENSIPEILPDTEARCMDCGHCVAICPHDALRHARISAAGSPAIQPALVIDAARAEQFLRSRRSVRRYHAKPVEKEKIQRLIEVARYAPTAGNGQSVEWIVIGDGERLRRIRVLTVDFMRELVKNPQAVAAAPYLPATIAAWDAGNDSILRGAPTLVTAIAPASARLGLVDLTLALSYLDVFAQSMGLGTCWAGLVSGALENSAAVREAACIPENYTHYYSIMLGYPAVQYHRLPERKTPKITFVE